MAGHMDINFPVNLTNSLVVHFFHLKNFFKCKIIFVIFSSWTEIVISIEFNLNPKNVTIFCGDNTLFIVYNKPHIRVVQLFLIHLLNMHHKNLLVIKNHLNKQLKREYLCNKLIFTWLCLRNSPYTKQSPNVALNCLMLLHRPFMSTWDYVMWWSRHKRNFKTLQPCHNTSIIPIHLPWERDLTPKCCIRFQVRLWRGRL